MWLATSSSGRERARACPRRPSRAWTARRPARRGHHLVERRAAPAVLGLDPQTREPGRGEHERVDLALGAASAAACRRCRGCPHVHAAGTLAAAARAGELTCRSPRRPGATLRVRATGRRRDRRASGTAAMITRLRPRRADPSPSAPPGRSRRASSASRIVSTKVPSVLRRVRAEAPSSPAVVIGTSSDLDAVRRELRADLFRLGDGERRAARADPQGAHVASGSMPSSSARTRAWMPSVPGSERSFSATIGSCRSFATMPAGERLDRRAFVGVRSRRCERSGRVRRGRCRRRGGGGP